VNVTSEQESIQLVEKVTSDPETILEAVVMLVGGFALGDIRQTGGADLQKMYTLNFESAYYVAKAAFLHMETQPEGGRLFFVGAKPAIEPQSGKDMIAYVLSKSLLFKLAELLNAEGRKSNVISTVVVPSTIDTARNRKEMPNARFSDWVRAEDIAQTIAFFCDGPGRSLRDEVVKVYNNA
jgi:NAD(P)-dependent dehydrogenase (short-subunit alcohol dehydrogenase family)